MSIKSKEILIPNRSSVYNVWDIDLKQGKNGDIQFCPISYNRYDVKKMEYYENDSTDQNDTENKYFILTVTPHNQPSTRPTRIRCYDSNLDPKEVINGWVSMNRPYYVSYPYFTSKKSMVEWATKVFKAFLEKRKKEFSSKKIIPFKEEKLAKVLESLELIKNKEFVQKLLWTNR